MAVIAAALVVAAGAVGSAATLPNIPTWYAGLNKPAFTPPNWLFGPVWTVLYVVIGIAFWRILMRPLAGDGRGSAIVWFLVQITLNALWSVAFFGMHSPLFGLVVIAALLASILMTILRFAKLDTAAAALLIPYFLWVCFATALNAAVFALNR